MITETLPLFFRQPSDGDRHLIRPRPTRVGKWTFTPGLPGLTPGKTATLQSEGMEVDLNYSSSIFADFLDRMRMIQDEFNRRSRRTSSPEIPADDYFKQASRV